MIARRTLLAGLLALGGCASWWPARPIPEEVVEARLVSLSPAITETLGALGATDTLVGRSDWCTWPPEVTRLPAFGSSLTPDLEGLASARPTRILIQDHGGDAAATLTAIAPVERLPWLTLTDIQASTRALGALTDRAPQAEALADRLGATLAPTATPTSPRVLGVIGTDGPAGEIFYVRSDSLHGDAILAAGGRHALPDPPAGAPTLTAERVIALDPDVIVLLESRSLDPSAEARAIAAWSVLEPVTAVKHDRVHVLHGDGLLSTGPRVMELVPKLREAIAGGKASAPGTSAE